MRIRAWQSVVVGVSVLLMAACSPPVEAGDVKDSTAAPSSRSAEPEGRASASSTPASESSAGVSVPDACALMASGDIARGVQVKLATVTRWTGELSPYELESAEFYKDSDSTCWWSLDPQSKAQLGMDPGATGERDVEIAVRRYGFHEWRTGGTGAPTWSDEDPETLLREFYSAHQEQVGSNAVSVRVAGEPSIIQDGSVVIVAGKTLWAQITLFGCYPEKCGDQAVSLAKVVQEVLASAS